MKEEKSQKNSTEDSSKKAIKKKLHEYSDDELDKIEQEDDRTGSRKLADLFAESIKDALNNPENHDKSN